MAIKLEGAIKRWVGLSTDIKPSPEGIEVTEVPPGSSFLESDTGRIYRWTGLGWALFMPLDENGMVLEAILNELIAIRGSLDLIGDNL